MSRSACLFRNVGESSSNFSDAQPRRSIIEPYIDSAITVDRSLLIMVWYFTIIYASEYAKYHLYSAIKYEQYNAVLHLNGSCK